MKYPLIVILVDVEEFEDYNFNLHNSLCKIKERNDNNELNSVNQILF